MNKKMAIPKYVATCQEDGEIVSYGTGDTSEEAYSNYLEEYAGVFEAGDIIYIYTASNPLKSDWPEEELDPNWEWVLDEKVDTKIFGK